MRDIGFRGLGGPSEHEHAAVDQNIPITLNYIRVDSQYSDDGDITLGDGPIYVNYTGGEENVGWQHVSVDNQRVTITRTPGDGIPVEWEGAPTPPGDQKHVSRLNPSLETTVKTINGVIFKFVETAEELTFEAIGPEFHITSTEDIKANIRAACTAVNKFKKYKRPTYSGFTENAQFNIMSVWIQGTMGRVGLHSALLATKPTTNPTTSPTAMNLEEKFALLATGTP